MNEGLNPIFDIMRNRERKKQPEVIEENKDSVEADNQSQTEHEIVFPALSKFQESWESTEISTQKDKVIQLKCELHIDFSLGSISLFSLKRSVYFY